MKKKISKNKIASVVLPTTSVIALAISLPLTLTNLLNNELDSEVNSASAKQLSNSNVKAENVIANDGSTNLLPTGSQIVTLPQRYSNTPNPSNWSGVPKRQTLQSNQYSASSTVNLNVYSPTTVQAIIAIPKEYAENSNFSLNFYWTFLGNSKSLGSLKNTDDANPDNRTGQGQLLPSSWSKNTLYKTPDGQYRLVSDLSIPQQYAPYFYNEHQSGNWQGMSLDNVAQYFNFVLTQGQSTSISTYSTASSVQTYNATSEFVVRVESDGISSKSPIQFETNLDSQTNYINGQPITLTVKPFNVQANGTISQDGTGIYKYKYQWYLNNKLISNSKTSIQNSNTYSGANTNTLTINNSSDSLNGATIYCKVIGPMMDLGYDGQNQDLKGEQQISGSSNPVFSSSNVTTLNQITDFKISSANVSVANSNINNQNGSTTIVPQGQSVTLIANAVINPIYDKYLKYQWYHNDKLLSDKSDNTLVLNNVNNASEGTYYCNISLMWNGKQLQSVQSNVRTIDVVSNNNFSVQLAFQAGSGQANTPSPNNNMITVPSNCSGSLYAVPYLGGQSEWASNNVTYQWYKDGIAITQNNPSSSNPNNFYGGNKNILQNQQMLPSSSGAYTCVATYKYPNGQTITATSNTIFLNVSSFNALSIYQNLQNITVQNGQSATLNFGVSCGGDSSNIQYTWQYKAPNSSSWNTFYVNSYTNPNQLQLTPQQTLASNGYTFKCQASYQSGWGQTKYVTSNTATISVETPNIKILSQPISISNGKIGSSQTLSVEAVIDSGNNNWSTTGISYQWCTVDNKNKITPISNATNASYTISNLSVKDNNTQYVCYVYPTNVINPTQAGKLTNVTTVTVLQPTINPASLTIHGNTNLMVGDSTTLSVNPQLNYDELPAGYSLKYQWYKSDVANDSYVAIDNGTSNSINISNVTNKDDGVMYWCEVSIMSGNDVVSTAKSRPAILNINNLDTISIQLPSSVKSYVGGQAIINAKVSIDGKEPDPSQNISYQWKVAKPSQTNSKELTWSDVNQATSSTLTLNNVTATQNGEMYALQITIGGSTFISNFPTTLEVYESSYVVNLDSTNVIVNEKQTATIKANVTQIFSTNETNFQYQWFVLPKGSQATKDSSGNVLNGQKINGATKQTLTLADSLSSWDGAQFYCQVTLGSQVQTSPLATLDVKDATITANALPYRIVANNGSSSVQIDNVKTSFDIQGATLRYQWQECTDGKTWKDISGQTNQKLDLSHLKTSDNGNGYRVVVTYADDNTVYETYTSNPTTLIVNSNVNVFINMPDSINAKIGSTLLLNPEVTVTGTNIQNDKVTYQWQKFDSSSNKWNDVGNSTNDSKYTVPTIQSSNNGDQYRLIVNVGEDSFTSDAITINACQNSFNVITSTTNVSTIIGGNVDASVSVNQLVGNEQNNYAYQWYASIDGQEPVVIQNQTTSQLKLENAQSTWNNAKFYCVVTSTINGQVESVKSKEITLNVNQVDILNTDLPPQVLSNNGSATFTLNNVATSYQISNTQLTYQWYSCAPGQDQWAMVDGATSNTLTLSGLTSKDNGKLYKCLIKYGDYASEYTNASILTVNSTLNVDIQMANQINTSIGQNVVIDPKIQVSGNNLGTYSATYQWQYSTNPSNENGWKDISGATNSKLNVGKVEKNQDKTLFRLIVTINGNKFTSNAIQLNVFDTPFVVNVQTDEVKVNVGSDLKLSVIVSQLAKLASQNGFTYKWYVVPNGGNAGSYKELPSSYNTASITLKNAQFDWNGAKFYCVVSNGETQVASNPITISINNNTISYDQLAPVVVVNDSKATITVENVKPGYTIQGQELKYMWQVNDGKNGWKDWTSQTNATVNLNNLTYLQNGYSFRCQITYGNTVVVTNATTLIIDSTANVSINLPTDVNGYVGGSVELKPTVSITGNNINPSEAKYQWQYSFVSMSGSYSWTNIENATQKELTISNLNQIHNNVVFRLVVTVGNQTFASNAVQLNIYSSPFVVNAITTHVNSNIGGDIDIFTFVVKNYETSNDDFTYQWYVTQNPNNLESATKIEGQNTSELILKGVQQSWNNAYFFCVAEQGDIKQSSQLVQLTVNPDSIQVDQLPTNTKVDNSNAVIEVKNAKPQYDIANAKISYQWQKYNGSNWENLKNQNASVLSLTGLNSNDNGSLYRCQITYGDGTNTYATTYTNATSLVVNLTVDVSIDIPSFINTYVNSNVTIKPNIKIQGTNLGLATPVYQWQKYNTESKTWENVLTNGNQENLTLSNVTSSNNNEQYRLSVSLNGLTFYSEATSIKVFNSSFAVNVAQQNVSTNIGQQFEISVNVNQIVGNDDTFTYQWYVIANNSSDSVQIKDATSSTLVLKDPQQSWNNAKFYCVVTSNNNHTTQQSQNIGLTINECKLNVPNLQTISIVKNDSVSISLGEVTPNYKIGDTQITYQWQKYNIQTQKWEDVSSQTNNTLTLNNLTYLNNGDMYRCAVYYGSYATGYSTPTTLVVNTSWTVNIQVPNEVNTSINQDATLTPTIDITGQNIGNDSLKTAQYQWQVFTNNNWVNVDTNGNSQTLTLSKVQENMNGNLYRLVVKVGGNTFTSSSIKLNVFNSLFTVNTDKTLVNTNIGQDQLLTLNVNSTYNNNFGDKYTYQWYYIPLGNQEGGNQGIKIDNATQSTLRLTNPQLEWSGVQFYCEVSLNGETQTSPKITLSVNKDNIYTVDLPSTVTSSDGVATIKVTGAQASYEIKDAQFAYQWYQLVNNKWTLLDGQTSETLKLTSLTSQDNGNVYRCVVSYTNGSDKVYSTYTTNTTTVLVNASASAEIKLPNQINVIKNGSIEIKPDVSIKSNASNSEISYQWQYTDPTSYGSNNPIWKNVESNGNQQDLTLTSVPESAKGYYLRLTINIGGALFTSNNVMINVVDSPFAVNAATTNYSANAGSSVTMSVNVDNLVDSSYYANSSVTYKYQWYYADPTFAGSPNATDEQIYKAGFAIDGQTSSSLTLNDLSYGYDRIKFFCKVTQVDGDKTTTLNGPIMSVHVNQLQINVADSPSIVFARNSEATLEVKGISTSYDISGAQLRYQWYNITNGQKVEVTNANNSILKLTGLTSNLNGNVYMCEVSYVKGDTVYDTIQTQPTSIAVNTTMNVNIYVAEEVKAPVGGKLDIKPNIDISGDNLGYVTPIYQWQYVDPSHVNDSTDENDLPWQNITDYAGKVPQLDINKVTKEMNGFIFRLKVNVLGNTFTSNPIHLEVTNSSFVVNSNTTEISSGIGQTTSVNVTVSQTIKTNEDSPYSYQWYVISNDSQIGQDGSLHGNAIEGATQAVLNLKDIKESWNNAKFYCVVTQGEQQATSQLITLNVKPVQLTANDLPVFVNVQNGQTQISISNVQTNYNILNTQITYQWQKLNANNEWVNVPLQTNATLNLSGLTQKDNGAVYRCQISYGNYATMYTSPSTLIVNSTMNVSVNLANQINGLLNSDLTIVPNVSINGDNLDTSDITYQWKVAKNTNTYNLQFEDVPGEAGKQAQLTLDDLTQNQNGNWYQLVINLNGNTFTSNPIQLHVLDASFVVNVTENDVDANLGSNITIKANIDSLVNEGSSDYKYQWYVVPSKSSQTYSTYATVSRSAPAGVIIPNANSSELKINGIDAQMNGAQFYCEVSLGNEKQYSAPVSLKVNECVITCEDTPIVYYVEDGKAVLQINNAEVSYEIPNAKINYQWQQSSDNGKTWTNLDGETKSTLELNDLTNLNNGYLYRCVLSYGSYVTENTTPTVLIVQPQSGGPITPGGDDNTIVGPLNDSTPSAWIAIPIVFGSIAAIGGALAIWWFIKKRNTRWGS